VDIREYIYAVADIFPGPLKTAARWVADRVFSVWDNVSAVFRVAIPRWGDLVEAAAHFGNWAMQTAIRAALAIRWIVLVRIPAAINALSQAVVSWTSNLINDVRNLLTSTRDWLLDQIRQRVNAVVDFINNVYRWTVDRLADIWETLSTVAKLVGSLLTDPTKLATWAIAAIWGAFWRFADQHVDAVVEFFWARRSIVVTRFVARAEALLERLL
jgi:hypothetical protein